MTEVLSLAEARAKGGLRLAVIRGVPSPWTQAALGFLRIKGIEHTRCTVGDGESVADLVEWTGQESYPAAMYEDERPRSGWAEILLLCERLAPTPRLIPEDPARRAWFFGLGHEICGEMGLGWARRLCAIHAGYEAGDGLSRWLGDKYGYRADAHAQAERRVTDVLELLHSELAKNGGEHLLGEFSALDVYWATFCNLISPLPPEKLALPKAMEPIFRAREPEVLKAITPELLALRDRVYEQHLALPVEL